MSERVKVLITIITESIVERSLLKTLDNLGVKGYTVMDVRGKGSTGSRGGDWQETSNIRVEVICKQPMAATITEAIKTRYFDHYATALYETPVTVVRSDKY